MKDMKKRSKRILLFGVGLGLPLLAIQEFFDIDPDLFWQWYKWGAVVLIVGVIAFNLLYHRYYMQKLKAWVPQLEAGDAQGYIQQIEAVLPTIKGAHTRRVYTLNLSVGYSDLGDHETAKKLLESLTDTLPKGLLQDVQTLNLCLTYFKLGEGAQAMALYGNKRKELMRLGQMIAYAGHVKGLELWVLFYQKQYQETRLLLEECKKAYPDARLQTEYAEMAQRLDALGF